MSWGLGVVYTPGPDGRTNLRRPLQPNWENVPARPRIPDFCTTMQRPGLRLRHAIAWRRAARSSSSSMRSMSHTFMRDWRVTP